MTCKSSLLPIIFLLALTGCTVGPKYKRPTLDIPAAYRAQPPELASQSSPESLGNAKWWEVFHDEQLQSLIRTALQQNYDVRIAAERVVQAQAQLGITHADQLPSLSAGVGLYSIRQQQTSTASVYRAEIASLSGSAQWDLDFWGRYRKATEASRADLAATEWGQKEVVRTLVSNLAGAYFRLRALDLELEITQKTLKSRQDSLQLTQLLAEHGSVSMVDVRQAEQLVYAASSAIPDIQRQIEQQENAISILIGQNPGSIQRGKPLFEQPRPPEVPAGIPSELIARRPDIREAEERLIAANARIGVAKAQYFPDISLTGNTGTQSTALTSLFSAPANLWTVGPSLVQPIFTGGRLRNNVRLTEAQQREALLSYRQTVQGAFRDVSDALVAYQKSRDVREQQELLVGAAKESTHLAMVRYEGGTTAYLEVLTNDTNYYSAELGLVQSRLTEMMSLVQLYTALGGGWN